MPGPKYKAVLVKCSADEHREVMLYAKAIGRGVGPMLRAVPFNVLCRRAERFNDQKFGSEQRTAQAVTAEWAWLGKHQTQTAKM